MDLIFETYAALAPEALDALSPEERRKVYVTHRRGFGRRNLKDERCVRRGDPGLGNRRNVKTFLP